MKFDPRVMAALKRLAGEIESGGPVGARQELIPAVALHPAGRNAELFDDAARYVEQGGGRDLPAPPKILFRGDTGRRPVIGGYDTHPDFGAYGHASPHIWEVQQYGRPKGGGWGDPSVVHQLQLRDPASTRYFPDFGIEREAETLTNFGYPSPAGGGYEMAAAIGMKKSASPQAVDFASAKRNGRTWTELLDEAVRIYGPDAPADPEGLRMWLHNQTYEAPVTRHMLAAPPKSMILAASPSEDELLRYAMEALPFQG